MTKTRDEKIAKKGTGKKAPAIMLSAAAACAILAGVANVASSEYSSFLDHYLGGRPSTVKVLEGSEGWDATYYEASFDSKDAAKASAEKLVTEVANEGIVLLKNDNGALPLAGSNTVSLIGRYAADPVYGGAGSGTVSADDCTDFYAGLTEAGIKINDTAYNFIKENVDKYPKANIVMDSPQTSSYYIGEIPFSAYSDEAKASLDGTTGVVVIGRGGGEGGDLSTDLKGDVESGKSENFTANAETANYAEGQHQLELTVEELELIQAAKDRCDSVIVVLNASTSMELGQIAEGGSHEVDAILQVGSVGSTGAKALGKVLTGEVNPSGRTTNLFSRDFTADPTFANFAGFRYTDVENFYASNPGGHPTQGTAFGIEYEEGIYVGYRYYETAAVEAANGNYEGFDYDKAVVYPFGHGLSYTEFDQKLDSVTVDGDKVRASVTVTNTGDVAGKSVAQLYYSAPYTPGGIEKSAVVLGAFGKTAILSPGESQTLELEYNVSDMASYDDKNGEYVLDAGDYVVSLRANSHDVIAQETLEVSARSIDEDAATGTKIENRFEDLTSYMDENCENLSRADFAGTFPVAGTDRKAADLGISFEEYDPAANQDPEAQMPTTGADNGLSLIDLRGKPYNDPEWELLLDQISVDEMTKMINDGAYNTAEIESVSKPATHDPDGPAGFTSLMGSTGNAAWCSEYLMAQTFNTDLMRQVGEAIGEEALASGYNGWYAPAMNMHRSPFAGRNFEYYSEDPLLAGKMGAAVVSGAGEKGVYPYVKHFVLNDKETYRVDHLATWADEQTMREIYLRPFEITVKEASYEMEYISDDEGTVSTVTMPATTGIMGSFNFLGTTWAGGSQALMTDILRNEWGFEGMVITDFNLYGHMDKNQGLAAGTDLHLTYSAMTGDIKDTASATAVEDLRRATKNILFTTANSNAMNGMAPGTIVEYGTAPWQYAVWGVSAALLLVAGGLTVGALRKLGVIGGQKRADDDADNGDAPAAAGDPVTA